MTWVRVCDTFDTDRRIEDVSLDACGLLIRAAAYSAHYGLDGHVDGKWVKRRVRNRPRREKLVRELVEARLVGVADDPEGFRILSLHDDREPLLNAFNRKEVEDHREYEARKKRNQRQRERQQSGTGEGSVPTGHPRDSLRSPRSGRPGQGQERFERSDSKASDPRDLTQEERAAERERLRRDHSGWVR